MGKVTLVAVEPVAERLEPDSRRVVLEEEVGEGETLEAFVRRLCARFPALAGITLSPASDALLPAYRVHVNGRRVTFFEWSSTVLKDGDRVLFRRKY